MDQNTNETAARPQDAIFVEQGVHPITPLVSQLQAEGYFTIVRVDRASSPDDAPTLFDAAIGSGANVLVSDFVAPWDDSGYTVHLPCAGPEFCIIEQPVHLESAKGKFAEEEMSLSQTLVGR